MQNKTVLYNLLLPLWLLWILPITWIVILPGNFLIDLLVLVLTMKHLNISDKKQQAKKSILRIWLCGFVADFIGALGMLLAELIEFDYSTTLGKWWNHNITNPVAFNAFSNIWSFLWVGVCVFISAFFIYLFNYRFCLNKTELEKEQKKKVALAMAVFTAPYLFYFPSDILY